MATMSRRMFLGRSAAVAVVATGMARGSGAETERTMSTSFQAGVARRDITPDPGAPMWGYSDRQGPATGTLDPLLAKVLALRAGDVTAALVTLDLGRVPMRGPCDRIRAHAKEAGVDHVVFVASHTHHAPAMEAEDAPYALAIEAAIGDALEEAVANLAPARIGVGRTRFDVAHNRRIVRDGQCLMLWRNEERIPTSPVDPEAGLIKIDHEDGRPLAVLVHFACHPVVMGSDNRLYSADYCGEMARLVQEKTGAECLFLQGACGDINPYLDKTPLDRGGVEAMRATGRTCAEAAVEALAAVETAAPARPSLACSEKDVHVGSRWDFTDPAIQSFYRTRYGGLFDRYLSHVTPDLAVPLAVWVLNGDLALACMPGELFVQYQIDLKQGSPLKDTFLCGYANEFHLYFPTVRDAAAGGYGGSVATYVGLGAGDKLVTESCIEIGRLTGALRPVPAPEDFAVQDYTG